MPIVCCENTNLLIDIVVVFIVNYAQSLKHSEEK